MKLIDVAEFYSEQGGGVRTYIHQKFKAANRFGHELIIVAPGLVDREECRDGGRIIWLKSPYERFDKRYHRFDQAAAIHRVLDIEKPDVVEASSPWMGARAVGSWQGDAVKSFIFHQDPVAVYPQTLLGGVFSEKTIDSLFNRFWRYLQRLAEPFHTTIVASHWLEKRLEDHNIGRPHAVPFGIEKQKFSPDFHSDDRRRRLLELCGITDPAAQLLICVSRHHPEKRLGTVLDGFAQAAQSLATQQRALGLVIVGDGPTRRFVHRHAARIPFVHIAGRIHDQTEIAAMLASSDALVHGGAAETFGLVIAEALCSGLPVVVPDRGGAADFADPLYSEVYKTGDKSGFAAAIVRLMQRPSQALRLAARTAGLARVWTPSDHFNALFNHYETLLLENASINHR